jgi:guanine deaminase
MDHNYFLKLANQEAKKNIYKQDGGPFGAIIVNKGKIIATAHNKVLKTNDPTAHAEILAIRKASKKLNRFDLSDCILYTSCYPCPMCFSAIHWAKIKKVYYGCTDNDAKDIGFDDKYIYDILQSKSKNKQVIFKQISHKESLEIFNKWKSKPNKKMY